MLDIEWVENQFEEGMNWENYGAFWEFDHIFPLCETDVSQEKNRLIVQNYRNIRPLRKTVHKHKARKITSLERDLFREIEVFLFSLDRHHC